MKINTVVRTKLGVYSCPSLRIAENQEQGKDKIRKFCPGLLKAKNFSFSFLLFFFRFFLFIFFWIFLFSDFLDFFGFSFFYFFWIFPFSIFLDFFLFLFFLIFPFFIFSFLCAKTKNEVTSLVLAAASNSFHPSNHHPLLGCLLNWAYDPQAAKNGSHPLSSGLTSNGQFSLFSYLGLLLTASSLHFFIWAYL